MPPSGSAEEPTDCIDCPYASTDCKSVGESITLATLPLKPGYWRASRMSSTFVQCYHAELCQGGTNCTGGRFCDGYCKEHHIGPFCELCQHGYVKAADGSCEECNGSVVLTISLPALILMGVLVMAAYCCYTGQMREFADATVEASFEAGRTKPNDFKDSADSDAV